MPLLPLFTLPDPVLRQKAKPVKAVDTRIARFLESMVETMYAKRGIGLAANQVGALERLIVLDLSESRDGTKALLMANPEITWASEESFTYNEGCLSVPEHYADVVRPKRIRLTYLDTANKKREIEAEDLISQCLQHEIDHLDGTLFIDHLSALKRKMILRKIEKARRAEEEGTLL